MDLPVNQIIQGDCLQVMKGFPENSIDCCITDPPYGLSREPVVADVMRHWLAGKKYEHDSKGFMGSVWDSFVPGPEYWRECYRAMKPGAHLLSFCSTRTWDFMSIAIRFAGFENRDTIASFGGPSAMAWLTGQGFPKSSNVADKIGQREGSKRDGAVRKGVHSKSTFLSPEMLDEYKEYTDTENSVKWKGWHTALKPSWEVILVFRKPISEKSVADNVLKWGTGAINVGATVVPFASQADAESAADGFKSWQEALNDNGIDTVVLAPEDSRVGLDPEDVYKKAKNLGGRWPSNLLLVHSDGCRQVRRKKEQQLSLLGDPVGAEYVEEWECVEDCPVQMLDRQGEAADVHPSGLRMPDHRQGKPGIVGFIKSFKSGFAPGDSGGVSRFFPNFSYDERERVECRFLYCGKTRTSEREKGLDDFEAGHWGDGKTDNPAARQQTARKNIHPTIKPISLMRWCAKLVCPKDGVILDPFVGSGSTCIAAALEGFNYIGIEQNEEYAAIARARINHWLRDDFNEGDQIGLDIASAIDCADNNDEEER